MLLQRALPQHRPVELLARRTGVLMETLLLLSSEPRVREGAMGPAAAAAAAGVEYWKEAWCPEKGDSGCTQNTQGSEAQTASADEMETQWCLTSTYACAAG